MHFLFLSFFFLFLFFVLVLFTVESLVVPAHCLATDAGRTDAVVSMLKAYS